MKYKIYDTQVHSNYFLDATDSIEDLYHKAIESGIKGIIVTDHCDMNLSNEQD